MCIYLLRKVREKIHTYFQKGENNTKYVTDYNGGNSTAATFSVVRKGPKKKSKYELWKEKQRL